MADLYASLGDIKHSLPGETGTTSSDDVLTSLIASVSALIDNFVSRTILTHSFTETRNGKGAAALPMPNFPITAVASVMVDGKSISASTSPQMYGYVFSADTIYLRGGCFSPGMQNVTVAYTAGFSSIPADINRACVKQVIYEFNSNKRIGQASHTTPNMTTDAFIIKDLLPEVRLILNQYRRVTIC